MVLAIWILAAIGFAGASSAAGSVATSNFSLPNTDSTAAAHLLESEFPAQSGDVEQVVIAARHARLDDPAVRQEVGRMLAQVAALPHIRTVSDPYDTPGAINTSNTVGYASVVLDGLAQDVPKKAVANFITTAQAASSSNLEVQLSGQAVEQSEQNGSGNSSELIGAALALIVLYIAFGALFAAVMPLLSAVFAIMIASSIVTLLSHTMSIASFASQLSILIGLGVGVDYALFIITRHRAGVIAGHDIEDAAVTAVNTSGRAVLFAGIVVCIALLGQFALGVSFLYGVALSAAVTVLMTMLTALTLLPAMLGFLGTKVLSRRERKRLAATGPHDETGRGVWHRWPRYLADHSTPIGLVALVAVVLLALPVFHLRLGLSDAGDDPSSYTSRQAYDLLAKGFGPGTNGLLTVVGGINAPGDLAKFDQVVAAIGRQPGVVSIGRVRVAPSGKAAIATAVPSTAPQAPATGALVRRLRSHVLEPMTAGGSLVVHLGGATALTIDFAHVLSAKLPLFLGVVVILALLLLMVVFRSLVVPLVASIMNLLSVGAAVGVVTAVFEWGWGARLIGVDRAGPVDAFVPVFLFSILFGLSMDYEVFLVSRIHEEWMFGRDNRDAVTIGQSATGRVITAAASIMILVFGSFLLLGGRIIKEFGLGLAGAIFIDAFIIRTALVPAAMHLLGKSNWWLPKALDRVLPHVAIDATELPDQSDPVPAGSTSS